MKGLAAILQAIARVYMAIYFARVPSAKQNMTVLLYATACLCRGLPVNIPFPPFPNRPPPPSPPCPPALQHNNMCCV